MAVSPVPNPAPAIAVVGVSALFPGSTDATGFWRDILAGKDLITEVPESHWLVGDYYDPDPKAADKTYCKRGAFLSPIDFDPVEHGIPPSIMPATDTSQLLALMVAKQVLDDATQGQFAAMDKERVSVILGVTSGQELFVEMGARLQRPQWLQGLREAGVPEDEAQVICDRIAAQYVPWQESSFPGLLGNVVAGRIANRFDLGGTNCVTDAACASSLSALAMGLNELTLGHSDMVIAGGVDTFNDISMFMCFSKTPALSATGDCRPFSDQADGTIIGEGLTMLALKRLDDAERDGDRIYAVIRGLGTSSDGRAMSVYAPLSAGQAKALRRTYAQAGYGPETVELLEAHGTGTRAGDAAEFGGLKMVFGDENPRDDLQWCALGSVKSQIGHTKSTAGAAGLFKVVMALHHKVLPPTIKVDRPNPKLEIEQSPFYLNTQARPWVRGTNHVRRASVSAFGFGGSNFHVALEEYVGPGHRAYRARTMPSELVVLTAAEPAALAAEARAIAGGELPAGTLSYLARTTQEGFDVDRPARLAVVAADEADLAKKLLAAAEAIDRAPKEAFGLPTGVHYAFGAEPGDVAFLFPGQGSQYVNMGADLAMAFDEARGAWDATRLVDMGEPLDRVVFPVPVFTDEDRAAQQRRLTETQWAQPAIGAASLAQMAVLRALGLTPDHAGGHSFGELTALAAAGVLSPEALLRVGRKRGELMADAGGEAAGTMAAVALSAAEMEEHLAGWNLDVVIANDNGPKQVVISGSHAAVEEAERRLQGVGATVRRLPVAAAFHSPLVAPASEPFAAFLAGVKFGKAEIPVYANTEAAPYPSAAAKQRALLASQVSRSVRFVEMIQAMHAAGARTFVEVGPGAVLTGLVSEILKDQPFRAVSLDRKGQHGVTALWHGLAQLAVGGVALDFAALWLAYAPAVDPRAKKKPAFSLPICGTNFGKVYPPKGGTAALPKPNPARAVAAPAPAPAAA
ncbi:MAG: polyketide synthase, partial [Cyanobacteria bacterium RYN_339]|nr:polyketide synthase [Cyanobacteria bacterium RYN_339]